jgi:hypothetical protein
MGQKGGQSDLAAFLVDGGSLDRGDLMLAKDFADRIKAAGERGITEVPFPLAGERGADRGSQGFFGIGGSPWALASAAAMAPTASLERCISHLHIHEIKADGTGF